MKKSNNILFALLAVVSAFLLWLWYYLGFNRVDDPLDLVISIVWWAVIVVFIVVIVRMEQTRRRRIRTVYVGDSAVFNSEKGLMHLDEVSPMRDTLASIIDNLRYDFTRNDFPGKGQLQVRYFVRTDEYEIGDKDRRGMSATQPATSASDVVLEAPVSPAGTTVLGGDFDPDSTAGSDFDSDIASASQSDRRKWKGQVVVVATKEERAFETPEELAGILTELEDSAV